MSAHPFGRPSAGDSVSEVVEGNLSFGTYVCVSSVCVCPVKVTTGFLSLSRWAG